MRRLLVVMLVSVGLFVGLTGFSILDEEASHPPHSVRLVAAAANNTATAVSTCAPAPNPCDSSEGVSGGDSLYQLFKWLDGVLKAQQEQFYRGVLRYDHWLAIGRCEQPGNGLGGINWDASGYTSVGLLQGGLGIMHQAWVENNEGMPASALDATPEQQMIVANRIYDRFGPGAWGCKA